MTIIGPDSANIVNLKVIKDESIRRLINLALEGIEQVQSANLLGSYISKYLQFRWSCDYVLKICSQRVYLLKQLRDQGLPLQKLRTVFQATVLSRLMYALPAWGPLLNVELVHKIDGFLKRSFRYWFTNKLITIQPLLDSATEDLFCKMKSSNHCLHPLLSPDRTLNQVLRTRGHSFQLPTCSFTLHKKSFVISCLLKFLTWVCSCLVCVVFSFLNSTLCFNFCSLLLHTTNYYDIYKSITACTFVAAIQ